MKRLRTIHGTILFLATLVTAHGAPPVAFNRDVKPILAEACFHCHGPDPGSRKAGLRLDTEAGFFDEAEPTVVKGKPEESELYHRITSADPDERMPPPETHKELKPEEIAVIKTWIDQGAPWEPHWSFIPPALPKPPEVNQTGWARNPIDHFVLEKLEAASLSPAPEADARTLVRRLALDLTGLPPQPEMVESFAANPTDEAWNALIDTLLESPQYGEHRARYWLDAARYGDTHGMHFDNYREMWPYRDWVVSAFNANQPFDRFTTEQLAGDLLPNPTRDQLIATGLQRCNITTNEGGTIVEENLANYAADRVQTMGWVFMGLTMNCAQCHDHKFDPISTKDYYAMSAFFRNTTQGGLDGNVKDGRGPTIPVPMGEDRARWDALPGLIADATKKRDQRRELARGDFDSWKASANADQLGRNLPLEGLSVHLPLNEGAGNEVAAVCGGRPQKLKSTGPITWSPDGKLGPAPTMQTGSTFDLGQEGDFEIDQPFSYGAWIKAGRNGVYGGIIARMDEEHDYRGWDLFQSDRSLAVHLVHRWPDAAIKVSTARPVLKPGEWQHVFVTWDGGGQAKGIRLYLNGVAQKLKVDTKSLQPGQTIRTKLPLRLGQRSHRQVFEGGSLQDARVYSRALTASEVEAIAGHGPLAAMLALSESERSPEQKKALYQHYLVTHDSIYPALHQTVAGLEAEREAIRTRSPITHIQEEKKNSPAMAHILARGQYDRPGEKVQANTPEALPPFPDGAPRNRLGLAQWVVHPDNPLTARVTVNRFWQELFGHGLVLTSEDFGIMGTPPTHPELLDWLAITFRDSGWDVKNLFKLMVNSAAYRQAAILTPEKLNQDPDNQLISRGPRFRMDAEMIRDYALAVSGALSAKIGGPSTRPYQPGGIWDVVGLPGGNTRNFVQDKGENLYRRTLYNFWKRMAPPPNLEVLNAPSREVCTVRRERTNTPLQALTTMNDIQFVEAARLLAQTALSASTNDAQTLDHMVLRVLCRPLKPVERSILNASLADLRSFYDEHPDEARALLEVGDSPADAAIDAGELATWTMLGNQLLNLDEVLNK